MIKDIIYVISSTINARIKSIIDLFNWINAHIKSINSLIYSIDAQVDSFKESNNWIN
jgi:hypothetical protein